MTQPSAVFVSPEDAVLPSAPAPRLRGRWLLMVRIGWVVVTLTLLVLNLIALPDISASTFTVTPQELAELHQLGLSPALFVLLVAVETVPGPLVYGALGLLLFWRRSDDPIALLCAWMFVLGGGTNQLYDQAIGGIVPVLANHVILRVVTLLLYGMAGPSLVLFFYVFPSGRFVPRWTRPFALLVVAYALAVVVFPPLPSHFAGPWAYLSPVFLLTAAVAQVYRFRQVSTPGERQQTKWVVFGLALAIALFVLYIPFGFLGPALQNDPVLGKLMPIIPLAELLIPLCITLAVLRTRLWDIDALINKAMVYGLLTALLALLYAGLIIGLESLAALVGGQAASNPAVLVVSTLVIFALFLPVRRRLQQLIDRRFYRRKYDAEQTLATFSATLRNEVDLEQLREHVLAVVQETMQPSHVSLWLRQPERRAEEPPQRLDAHAHLESVEPHGSPSRRQPHHRA